MRVIAPRMFAVLIAMQASPSHAASSDSAPELRVPLVAHLARHEGGAVLSASAVRTLVARVNRLFSGAGVCFSVSEVRDSERSANLETFRDRRVLRKQTVQRAINVFFVNSIRDPDPSESTTRAAARAGRKPSGWLGGAEIPAVGRTPAVYLIAAVSERTRTLQENDSAVLTLAHELGHFLGEGHHRVQDNLMSYGVTRTGFDAAQLERMRASASRQLRKGTLSQAGPCEGQVASK